MNGKNTTFFIVVLFNINIFIKYEIYRFLAQIFVFCKKTEFFYFSKIEEKKITRT